VGADTSKPAASAGVDVKKTIAMPVAVKTTDKSTEPTGSLKSADVSGILTKNTCSACHGIENKIVGPSFKEIAAKQGARADAVAYLSGKIKTGGSGVYGSMPMPALGINDADAKKVATWISQGAAK
jgi:cytochrome c